jgi:hypothetical protein
MTTAERARRARGRAAALVARVEPVGRGVYAVPSQSGGEPHVVAWAAGRWRCDCPAAGYHGVCAHVSAVRLAREAARRAVAA